MTPKSFVSSRVFAAEEPVLELNFYGDVGMNPWTGEGITAKEVKEQIDSSGKFSRILGRINSPGGDSFEGVAIFNLLRSQGKPITMSVDGIAASAASIIAMAGDKISMGIGSMMMVHNPWMFAIGNAEDLRSAADTLEKVAASLGEIYVKRTGKSAEEIKSIMDAETWYSAEEAVKEGFATETADSSPKALAAAANFSMLSRLRNVPEALKRAPETPAAEPMVPKEPASPESTAAPQGPPAENPTEIRERFKIKHKRRVL